MLQRESTAAGWILVLVGLLAACGQPGADAGQAPITVQALAERLDRGDAPLILDVRTPEEYAAGHIPGAVNIPHTELAERLAELGADRNREIVVHCRSGKRAALAEGILRRAGFNRVRDLEGHFLGWSEAGLPIVAAAPDAVGAEG
ncbi:MAG: rhodanese-like domain-containing protein [Gammaproteobacteria bacterium]|nr:MAG: rhodanese-like domain-containing protein [Gammaproteobacteria bacterium]